MAPASNHFPLSPTYHDSRDARRVEDRRKERDIREREAAAAEYKRRQNMNDYVSFICFISLLSTSINIMLSDEKLLLLIIHEETTPIIQDTLPTTILVTVLPRYLHQAVTVMAPLATTLNPLIPNLHIQGIMITDHLPLQTAALTSLNILLSRHITLASLNLGNNNVLRVLPNVQYLQEMYLTNEIRIITIIINPVLATRPQEPFLETEIVALHLQQLIQIIMISTTTAVIAIMTAGGECRMNDVNGIRNQWVQAQGMMVVT